ncbi:MAG: hypothetical protein IPK07_06695 [Deltaproteobacteria bacterium]|nr:hypothetical protein [Deltaproteobacteria bacterium]
MRLVAKLALIVGGYVAAFAVASAVVAVRIALTRNAPDAIASSGMYAGGDLLLFLGVFGAVALVPTGAALLSARAAPWFGPWLGGAAVATALSGTFAWLAYVQPLGRADPRGWLSIAGALAVLRLLGAPLVASGLAFAALAAPSRGSRRAVMMALAVEALLCLYTGFHFLVAPRL